MRNDHLNGSNPDGSNPDDANDSHSIEPPESDASPESPTPASSFDAMFDSDGEAELPEVHGDLGAQPSWRVLLLTLREQPEAAREIAHKIGTSAHNLRVMAEGTSSDTTDELAACDVLLLDAGSDVEALSQLCRRAKSALEAARNGSEANSGKAAPVIPSLVGVLPSKVLAQNSDAWSELRASGADGLLSGSASAPEMEAILEAQARRVHLRRDLEGARERLSRNLQFDDLTQLLNRRFFFQAAHREASRARRYNHPLACLMIDVDYLQMFNTSYGYACGDYILRAVANVVRGWTRDSDIAARFSESKFVVLLPETRVDGAIGLREKMQRVLKETPFVWEGHELPVTLSIGEAGRAETDANAEDLIEPDGEVNEGVSVSVREEMADLLADADAALFVAKKGARYPSVFVEYTMAPESILQSAPEADDEDVGEKSG